MFFDSLVIELMYLRIKFREDFVFYKVRNVFIVIFLNIGFLINRFNVLNLIRKVFIFVVYVIVVFFLGILCRRLIVL